jgi:hypothetical protein
MSIMFQGIHTLKSYRVVSRGGDIYSVYRKQGDAFIHAGTMRIEGDVTEEKVDEEFHQYPNEYDFSNEYGY